MNTDTQNGRPVGVLNDALREILHAKESICAELANLANRNDVTDYQTKIAGLSEAYAASGDIPPEFSELMDKKFVEARAAAEAGAAAFEERKQLAVKLASDVEALIAADDLATLHEIEVLEKKISENGASPALIEKLLPLKEKLQAEAAATAAVEAEVIKLTDELTALTAAEDITALHDRKPEIEKAFAELANIPRQAAQRYQDAHRKASVRLAQHYETLDLARWESYTLKLDICNELEKLCGIPENELGKASKTLNELREKWKKLGSVPKEKNDEINPRYLDLSRKLQHRVDEFFARKRQEQKLVIAEKEKLCIEAEELAESTDWGPTSARLRELQTQWKTLVRAGTKENELFQRFHTAADRFFTARKAVFDERDKRFNAAAERKMAIIAEAAALTDDVRRAKQLREEFRAAGSAGRKEPELYKQFNEAMERFFNGRREANAGREQRAKELISEVETLTAADPMAARERVKAIRDELRNLACRDTRTAEQTVLRKFDAALEAVRKQEAENRIAASGDVTMMLAKCYAAFKAGEQVELPGSEQFTGFPKLQTAYALISAAVNGDAKAAEKLEKQIVSARAEREQICSGMEDLAGMNKNSEPELDLAAELQAAMLGNFGKSEDNSRSRSADPRQLCSAFAASGIVPPDELEEFQKRFNAAKSVVLKN